MNIENLGKKIASAVAGIGMAIGGAEASNPENPNVGGDPSAGAKTVEASTSVEKNPVTQDNSAPLNPFSMESEEENIVEINVVQKETLPNGQVIVTMSRDDYEGSGISNKPFDTVEITLEDGSKLGGTIMATGETGTNVYVAPEDGKNFGGKKVTKVSFNK